MAQTKTYERGEQPHLQLFRDQLLLAINESLKVGHSNTSGFIERAVEVVEDLELELGTALVEEITLAGAATNAVTLNETIGELIHVRARLDKVMKYNFCFFS